MNYILRTILIRSGYYSEEDIEQKLTHTWYIAPHQYLHITLDDGTSIDINPWNYQFGIPYGKYGSGFSSNKIFSKI